ncbi:MAG: DUF499 domain-containing protein [Candidatus Bipolaricaulia bacterium]
MMKNWFDIAIPHEDIRSGGFDEAVFAADLGDVVAGRAAPDYNDPYTFFKKTYLTYGLQSLLRQVHEKLTSSRGPSVVELQTPFGGGKEAYQTIEQNDQNRIAPGKENLRALLEEHQPFVLLFDEILEYVVRSHGISVGDSSLASQTLAFFQELTEAVASLERGLMIVTLPSSELEDFGDTQQRNLAQLEKIFGRLESIETPVQGEEVYSIIRRRLFEPIVDETAMREVVDAYIQKYQQHKDELPPKAREADYRRKLELAYPFHSDVIDILYEKWGTFSSFQRTRGVLRFLANVIEDLYQREQNLDLILPGDLNLGRPSIRQEFINHIGPEYESIIGSDIAGVEAKSQALDRENRGWKHLAERIATAVFVHSFAADEAEEGTSLPYIKLAVLRPETIPSLVTEVLQKQANELWYLNTKGDRYYLSSVPNLNRMVIDKKQLVSAASVRSELERRVKRELGTKLRCYLWPQASDALPDNRELKLAVLDPESSPDLSELKHWVERRIRDLDEAFPQRMRELYRTLAVPASVRFEEAIVSDAVSFNEDVFLLTDGQARTLKAKMKGEEPPPSGPEPEPPPIRPGPEPRPPGEERVKHVAFRASGLPTSDRATGEGNATTARCRSR